LRGGHYAVKATGAFDVGDVVLQALSIDGSTWVPVGSPITAATYITFDLPPGHYRIAVVPDATAVCRAHQRAAVIEVGIGVRLAGHAPPL